MSRDDLAPKPPAPVRLERPNDDLDVCASSRDACGSYSPGSPWPMSSGSRRFEPDLNADDGRFECLSPCDCSGSYEPAPGVSAAPWKKGSSCCAVREPKPGLARDMRPTDRARSVAIDDDECS